MDELPNSKAPEITCSGVRFLRVEAIAFDRLGIRVLREYVSYATRGRRKRKNDGNEKYERTKRELYKKKKE